MNKDDAKKKLIEACNDVITRIHKMLPNKEVDTCNDNGKCAAWVRNGYVIVRGTKAPDTRAGQCGEIVVAGPPTPTRLINVDGSLTYFAQILEGLIVLHGMVEALPEITDGAYSKAMALYDRLVERVDAPLAKDVASGLREKAAEEQKHRRRPAGGVQF